MGTKKSKRKAAKLKRQRDERAYERVEDNIKQMIATPPQPESPVRRIARQFVAGEITKDEATEQLVALEYAESREIDEVDGAWEPGPGTFAEVSDAVEDGMLTDEIYEQVLLRRIAKIDAQTELIDVETEDVIYRGEPLTDERVEEIVARFDPTRDAEYSAKHSYQRRWEVVDWDGSKAIMDNMTKFVAPYEEASVEEIEEDVELLSQGKLAIDEYQWSEPFTGADVLGLGQTNDTRRFHALYETKLGYALLDSHTGLVHPLDGVDDDSSALSEARIWETGPEEQFTECRELENEGTHWQYLYQWVDDRDPEKKDVEPVETTPETPAAAHLPADLPEIRVLVVSSSRWAWKSVVREALQTYWNGVGNPPLKLLTSGSPYGAEMVARELAQQVEGVSYEQIDDDKVNPSNVDYAFAFITNDSEDATAALNRLLVLGIPTHIMREWSAVVNDPWLNR